MNFRLPLSVAIGLVLLTACPGDDSPAGTEGASSSSGDAGTSSSGLPPATSTEGTTGAVDSSDGGTTEATGPGTTGSGTTGDDSGSSSDEGSESGGSSSGGTMVDACDGPEVLLYEQGVGVFMDDPGSPAGEGAGGFARSADDFVIDPADQCWCITRVVLPGSYQMAMLSGDLEVGFYEDAGGLPQDPPLATDVGLPIDAAGSFDYTLSTPVVLDAATYWLSAMPQIRDVVEGIWFWAPGATNNGSHWAFESNVAMLPPGCIGGWTDLSTCSGEFSPFAHDDNAFEIYGVVGGDSCM